MTELEGRVRVVTNDRTVLTFAESFFHRRPVELSGVYPSLELGLAGICLDPEHGYVFVTFVYHDANDVLRNNIVRFTTAPGTFSVSPTSAVDFRGIFERDRSQVSHQVGPCQVATDWCTSASAMASRRTKASRSDPRWGRSCA